MSHGIPAEPPPSYYDVTALSPDDAAGGSNAGAHLQVPNASSPSSRKHSMSTEVRRSIEDQSRRLPHGWVRAYDTEAHHHFYVDTTKDPHRSIWVHPFDDDQYLSTLSAEEREQVEHESMYRGQHPSSADIIAAHSDEDEDHHDGRSPSSSSFPESLPPRSDGKGKGKTMDSNHRSFGSKMKDKLTGTTHEQREEQRRRRYEAEQKAMDKHLQLRAAVRQATITGQPVFLGKDTQGKDVYVQPPGRNPPPGFGGYNYPSNGRDPFGSTGMVETPTARFIRPSMPYGRPMGGAYGGGYGFPMMMGGGAFGAMMVGNSINMM